MAWTIDCTNCGKRTRAANIVELTERHSDPSKDHLDPFGWFLCRHCKSRGYIEKHYKLQEPDRPPWKPYLRVALRPSMHDHKDTYQPFAFLVGYSPHDTPTDIWFCYYKDTRDEPGGRLKMGHGPGGPPVFEAADLIDLIAQMVERGSLDPAALTAALDKAGRKEP